MNDSILAKVKALPPLDNTIVQIQKVCLDKDSSLADLSKIIEHDPMLTANILKAANSPLYGFSREVKNINHAVSLFGMATIRGFALSSAIKQNIKIDFSPYNMDNNEFLNISVLQSALMLNWYSKVNRAMLDILIPASFLMEVGKIIFAHELIENSTDEKFASKIKETTSLQELSQIEQEYLECTNEQIAAKIFEQWNLELELVEAIRHSNNPSLAPEHIKEYAAALQVVKTAVNIFERLSEDSTQNALHLVELNGLDTDKFLDAIKRVKQ